MTPLRLVTLNGPVLIGPSGPIALTDPRHAALLARLAAEPGRTLGTDRILLCIWPDRTPQQGAAELAGAAATLARLAGMDFLTEAGGQYTLSHQLECDWDRASRRDAPAFLAGFRLADTPEWDEWVSAARATLASRPEPGRRRPWLLPAAALALVAILGYAAIRPRPIAGFEPGNPVILADLEHAPEDSSLALAVQVAAVVGLQQSSRFELYPRRRIVESLRALGQSLDAGRLTADLAVSVASREQIPWVVSLALEVQGAGRRVTTRLLRVPSGEIALTAGRTASGMPDLVEAVDQSLRSLYRRTGEPAGRLRELTPLALATTADLTALRAYTDGSEHWGRGEFQLAGEYWQRALALDTGFAMAMGALGAFHYYLHNRAEGERYYQQALARIDRLTEWERLNLADRYAAARGDRDSSIALSRTIAVLYPRAGTLYNLGTSLLQARRCDEALEVLDRARRLDPRSVTTLINIATCQKSLKRYEEARAVYLEAERLDSTILYRGNLNLEFVGAALATGRATEAESVLVRMTGRPGMGDQALGYRGLGYLDLWRGRVALAREHFGRAAGLSRRQGPANSLVRNLALLAAAHRAAGDAAGVRRVLAEIDSALATAALPPGFLMLAAEPHVDEGGVRRVRELLTAARARADARNPDDSVQVHYLAGALALGEGDGRAALAALRQAEGLRFPVMLALRRALAQESLGQLDSARIRLRDAIAARSFGYEDQIAWLRALILIGDIEERLGRPDDAIASYRRFLQQWQGADPGLPDLVRVRSRLNALLARRDR